MFVPISTSHRAIDYLLCKRYEIIVDNNILEEAKFVLNKIQCQYGIGVNLLDLVDVYLDELGATIIKRGVVTRKRDRHVTSLSSQMSAQILTNDQELAYKCMCDGEDVLTPYMLILNSINCHEGIFNPADEIFKVAGLSSTQGSIYIQVNTSTLLAAENGYLAEISNGFSLKIDGNHVFLLGSEGAVILKAKLKISTNEKIVVSYSAHTGRAILKTAVQVADGRFSHNVFRLGDRIFIGSNSAGTGQLGLGITSFIYKPSAIGKDSLKFYFNQPDLRPNPYDEDLLHDSIRNAYCNLG